MPFRARFECLWCGDAWTCRGPDDLEGWAQLCPACLGRAGTNHFLKVRLHAALEERAASGDISTLPAPRQPPPARQPLPALPDDWFLRRGSFERGPIHDAAWTAELDVVTRWLDAQPLRGRILEPAAGVGFFSPLLAERGELHASDVDGAALDVARSRLLAHRQLAHLHEGDPWARPAPDDPPFDVVVAAFLVGRVRGAGLDPSMEALRARLRTGGALLVIDLRPDPAGGPPPGLPWTYHNAEVLEAAVVRAGFAVPTVTTTGRFFLALAATAA